MTDQSDQEILELADKIRRNQQNKADEENKKLESIRINKLIGKYYSDIDHHVSWDGTAINVYRILPSKDGWGEAKIERYYYYHGGHYGISVITYNEGTNGVSPNYDKEIDKHIFWHEVNLVLDRIGVTKEIGSETNH